MSIYAKHAVLDVRKYLLQELYASGVFNFGDYPTIDPVVPIQQLPETNDSMQNKPFIVYDLQPLKYQGTDYWICRDMVTFTAYSVDYMKVLEVQNLLIDLFRRYDLSAADVNAVASNPSGPNKFLFFEITGSNAPDAAREENGRYGGSVIVEYEYTRSIGDNGRNNF